ncbi:hypothetical protein B5C34_08835 [Pacificimonas flava]|uniref:Uncharacterized protein n=2 Tax=Pacificimonas TaxID=1960290 RepID=A0A219B5D6_9SPHN|nr:MULTISPECIES: hypothetical protein [Pacificimonas]MBZ6379229.1 hypothetical protein [Pacificimonas aurantium]OWV33557.1 hypothetical protein B5C34_08835 [Pacificimonas flava]
MSFDQKPARVRVYSSGVPAANQGDSTAVAVAGEPAAPAAGKKGFGLLGAALFLAGSGLGGAAFVYLVHMGLLP